MNALGICKENKQGRSCKGSKMRHHSVKIAYILTFCVFRNEETSRNELQFV